MTGYVEITKDAAAEAARAGAFTCEDGRVIVHSFLNGWLGADWDLEEVLAAIRIAEGLYWQDGIAGHDLAVIVYTEGDAKVQYNFDVKRPADVLAVGAS